MASFLQPATYNNASNDAAVSTTSKFLIYTNSILSSEDRFSNWYQIALLVVGCSFFGIASLRPITWWISREIHKWRRKDEPKLSDELADFTRRPKDVAQQPSKAFGQYVSGDINSFLDREYDLYVLDLKTFRSRPFGPTQPGTRRQSSAVPVGAVSLDSRRGSVMVGGPGKGPDLRRMSIANQVAVDGRRRSTVAFNNPDFGGGSFAARGSTSGLAPPDSRRATQVAFNMPNFGRGSVAASARSEDDNNLAPIDTRRSSDRRLSVDPRRSLDPRRSIDPRKSVDARKSVDTRRNTVAFETPDNDEGTTVGLGVPSTKARKKSTVAFSTPNYKDDEEEEDDDEVPALGVPTISARKKSSVAFHTPDDDEEDDDDEDEAPAPSARGSDARKKSTVAFDTPDYDKDDVPPTLIVPAIDARKKSAVAFNTPNFRRGSLGPRGSIDLRKKSLMAAGSASPDLRKMSLVASHHSSSRRPTFDDSAKALSLPPNTWILINKESWLSEGGPNADNEDRAEALRTETLYSGIGGLIVDAQGFEDDALRRICNECLRADLDVMLLEDPESPTLAPVYPLVAGVVFKNASILPDGTRRDFFRSTKLRTALARCKMQQKTRDDFFLGFLDLWRTKPTAAVVRRANKMAKFHKACLHQAAMEGLANSISAPVTDCASAFDWIKVQDIVKAQENWITSPLTNLVESPHRGSNAGLDVLATDHRLAGLVHPFRSQERKDSGVSVASETPTEVPPPYTPSAPPREDFWTHSSQNRRMCDRGCFDLREELFEEQYEAVVRTQQHLEKLGLLEPVEAQKLTKITEALKLCSTLQPVNDFLEGIVSGRIVLFLGLDSGFRLPDNQGHFWGVSSQMENGILKIYVSLKAPEPAMVILHTYLAHLGVARRDRLYAELELATRQAEKSILPGRIIHELQSATYSELLFMLEQMHVSGVADALSVLVRAECQRLLVVEPTRLAFVTLQCNDLLAGRSSIRDVIKARLDLLEKAGARTLPVLDKLVEGALEMDKIIQRALFESDEVRLKALSQPIIEAFNQPGRALHPTIDLYALMFFTSLRKCAFEEVYLETTDRCPLFLQQRDQAAVFAEMWALGSQCEIYFGIKPRALGAIIYDRYREFLQQYPPTTDSSKIAEVFTAYQTIDGLDNENGVVTAEPGSWKQRWQLWKEQFANATFLTVFCVPAIVDVCLLTFLGRGLYLTAFMSRDERLMANYAVLSSLIMTAGVTGWTGSTGGFYLHTAAFNNMNHFMVQRVSGGFMLASIFAVCGFIAFGVEYGWYSGFIFAAYVMVLSTYLNILGVLTTMHRNNAPLLSGRTVLLSCMSITLVSPVLSTFVNGHDVLIYLLILYFFLFVLIYAWMKLARSWVTWMENVVLTNEKEIMKWYESLPTNEEMNNLPKHLQRGNASLMLMDAIDAYGLQKKSKKSVGNEDAYVAKLADSHKYTVFMLKQDDPISPLPEPYGPTWLTRMKLALENQRALAHGLKEHNPFLLFRKAKYDIGQNVGFFLVVLLDRWVAVSMSANGKVINLYYDVRSRYGIAFGLLYFLICAVSLDIVLQRYWGKTGRTLASKLGNLSELDLSEEMDARLGRKRWLIAAYELTSIMAGVFGFTTIFVWLLVIQHKQVILYLLYILGYSGALLFQFNRVFTTNIRAHVQCVFVSSAIGYVLGIILHELPATRAILYIDVIALNVASLLAAFSTWLFTDFTADAKYSAGESPEEKTNWKTYSQKTIGSTDECELPHMPASSPILSESNWGTEVRFEDGTTLSRGVRARLVKALDQSNNSVVDAFEDFREILEQVMLLWEEEQIRLFVLSRKDFVDLGGSQRYAFSKMMDDTLHIVVGIPALTSEGGPSGSDDLAAQVVAEALLHEACEGAMQMRHAHATLAELLLNEDEPISTRMAVQLAETSMSDLSRIIAKTNEELMNHLCIGVNPDITWEQTPEMVRLAIVSRVIGKNHALTPAMEQWLLECSDSLLLRQISLRQTLAIRAFALYRLNGNESSAQATLPTTKLPQISWQERLPPEAHSFRQNVIEAFWTTYAFFLQVIEFIAVITTAGTDAGRELWGSLPHNRIRFLILWPLLKLWTACWYVKEAWLFVLILSQDEDYRRYFKWARSGGSRTLKKGRLVVDDPITPQTGFVQTASGIITIFHYLGTHATRPEQDPYLIATYDEDLRLSRAEYLKKPAKTITQNPEKDEWVYHFSTDDKGKAVPSYKMKQYMDQELREYYDDKGRIVRGECVKEKDVFEFVYTYKSKPRDSRQLLRATYIEQGKEDPTTWDVYWCNADNIHSEDTSTWVPCQKITCLTKTSGSTIEEVRWRYDHKRDPVITRYSSGGVVSDEAGMIELAAKRIGILTKPTIVSLWDEDFLQGHSRRAILNAAAIPGDEEEQDSQDSPDSDAEGSKLIGMKKRLRGGPDTNISTVHYHLSTYALRTALWKHWSASPAMSALIACRLDEMLLRRERTLRPYWSYRDAGRFREAKKYFLENLSNIIAESEMDDVVAQKLNLAIKPGDLYIMGLSKDSNYMINTPEESYIDTDDRVAVVFTDTGCWPDAPGGVSNCRRDLVDGHKTIRNYALTEGAYDWATPRFNVERNVQLMQNMPLWGLDGKTPKHGLYDNLLQVEVDQRARVTSSRNIKEIFIPLITRIIRAARTKHNSNEDLRELTLTFLRLNEYFETNDYITSWRSNAMKRAWREAWLHEYNDPNVHSLKGLFPMERPTRQDFEEALELYIGYFFVFSIRIPEKVPKVYQSTHHGISSLWGMCLKLRRGTAWGIWDHAILWRESCLNISTAQCFLPIPVQNMLLATMKVASHLAYMHADIILPCTDTFNPTWEIDVGTDQGCLTSRSLMVRKIDPITNGIANMGQFTPIEKIRTKDPTCIMLSNIQFIKDVKNAISAAGVIINDFGFKTYNLVVYGAQDRQPSYMVETEEMIASLGIGGTVRLGGFGSPKEVLKDAWLFMNSSLSEGLPLAIGEAALSGIPIVATEVGATAQVLTDVDDPSIKYGEVVSPNDPVALARAQISLLAMLGPWAKYTTDAVKPPPLPTKFTPHDVEWITKRMHDKVEDRRALGMKLREVVIRKFNGDRYIREHEQMYWIQRHMSEQRGDRHLEQLAAAHPKFNQPLQPKFVEYGKPEWMDRKWQDFKEPEVKVTNVVDDGGESGGQTTDEKKWWKARNRRQNQIEAS